jgi:DNA-binding transcriptional MerR regulator
VSTRRAAAQRTGAPRPSRPAVQRAIAEHRDDATGELYGIGELCEAFGVTPRTLRFYEDKGLLSPRRVNGTRIYTRRDRARLTLIIRSKAIGASLAEIRQYLDMYGPHGEGRAQQLKYVLQRTDRAIAELQQKRAHIDATLAELRLINDTVRQQLTQKA